MAYDEQLAARVNETLISQNVRFSQKKMFGGVAFMVHGKMCLGVLKQDLMVRFDPDDQEKMLQRTGAREMDFTHRPMKGYVFVDPTGYQTTAQLRSWVKVALEFNPKAKAAKKEPAKKRRIRGKLT